MHYESTVNWRLTQDLLRCNPVFHGAPRYDNVLINQGSGAQPLFARLVIVFTYRFNSEDLPLALIHPYDILPPSEKDRDLELVRLRLVAEGRTCLVPVRAFIRGVLLAPEFDHENTYHLVDVVDSDIFLRTRHNLFVDQYPN